MRHLSSVRTSEVPITAVLEHDLITSPLNCAFSIPRKKVWSLRQEKKRNQKEIIFYVILIQRNPIKFLDEKISARAMNYI